MQGRRREGPGRLHHCFYKHRTPVDGLHKHDDDISLCFSYFSPPLSQTFHVTFFFCHPPPPPPRTPRPLQNAPPYYNANKMFCLGDTSLMCSHSSFFQGQKPSIIIFFSKKRSVTRRHYCNPNKRSVTRCHYCDPYVERY